MINTLKVLQEKIGQKVIQIFILFCRLYLDCFELIVVAVVGFIIIVKPEVFHVVVVHVQIS